MDHWNKLFLKVSIGWIVFWFVSLLIVQPMSVAIDKLIDPIGMLLFFAPPVFLMLSSHVIARVKQDEDK